MNQNDCSGKTLKLWPVFVDHYRLTFTEELIEQNDDISPEDHAQRFDADFVLFTSVVMEVLDTMIKALGGESPGLITTPSDEQQGVAAEAKQPEKTFH